MTNSLILQSYVPLIHLFCLGDNAQKADYLLTPIGSFHMLASQPSVLTAIVSNLQPYFAKQGLDFSRLARASGISVEGLCDPDQYVSLTAFAKMLETAAERVADPCFGLHCAEAYPIGPVSVLGHIIMNAPTTLDALTAMQRYMRLIVWPASTSCKEDGGLIYWTVGYPVNFNVSTLQLDLFSIGIAIRRLRQNAGNAWSIEALEFNHPDPGCHEECTRLLAPKIIYNRPDITLVLNAETANQNRQTPDQRLYAILQRHAEMLLAEQPNPSDIVALTRNQIERLLSDGKAELQTVAAQLQISPRTLRAKLARANVNFSGLLDEVRAHRARYYLKETEMQVTEVAFLLGFSELSAFTRAGSRWLGMSPRAYRRAQRKLDKAPVEPAANNSNAGNFSTNSD